MAHLSSAANPKGRVRNVVIYATDQSHEWTRPPYAIDSRTRAGRTRLLELPFDTGLRSERHLFLTARASSKVEVISRAAVTAPDSAGCRGEPHADGVTVLENSESRSYTATISPEPAAVAGCAVVIRSMEKPMECAKTAATDFFRGMSAGRQRFIAPFESDPSRNAPL